jgi:glycosyltransferase involved in cell wall biosynthesis
VILLSHPTGNTFVRALVSALERAGRLDSFYTTLAIPFSRRDFPVPFGKIKVHPFKELLRLAGAASVDDVYRDLDEHVSKSLRGRKIDGVYAYEDGARATFETARGLGLKCFYELPIAYWETSRKLLLEEAKRLPLWEPTLGATRDSQEKLDRKTKEIGLADVVICPSRFVLESLPEKIRQNKKCVIARFGSPKDPTVFAYRRSHLPFPPEADPSFGGKGRKLNNFPSLFKEGWPRRALWRGRGGLNGLSKLRLLFAGTMTQRKGLADVFSAMKILKRKDVELVVMGTPLLPMAFYRKEYPDFIYEPTRSHAKALELMRSCDALVLPSIVEGRALVQQEAMACGLPLIVTKNAGAEDLIEQGRTGFLVPTTSPEKIAEKIAWLADHRDKLPEMAQAARRKAAEVTWEDYCQKILEVI